jgi:hypothetical protein
VTGVQKGADVFKTKFKVTQRIEKLQPGSTIPTVQITMTALFDQSVDRAQQLVGATIEVWIPNPEAWPLGKCFYVDLSDAATPPAIPNVR